MPCRVNRRQTWSLRIQLEALCYPASSFATLTYSPEHLPPHGSLSKKHWREFSKNLGFRYFGCGEYGGQSWRPHYHLVVFGMPATTESLQYLQGRWRYGFVSLLPYELRHGRYIAGYVVKKLTKMEDTRLPEHCIPEFAVMSRRPAVGTHGLSRLLSWLGSDTGRAYVAERGDVPHRLLCDGKMIPLGRTMVSKLRQSCGVPLADPKRLEYLQVREELLAVEFPDLLESRERKQKAARVRAARSPVLVKSKI